MSVRDFFNPIPFICKFKEVTSYAETTLFRHLEIRPYQIHLSASILLHGDPDDKFQPQLEEFIFCRHIFTCHVGKYSIIVLKLQLTLTGCGMVMT